MQHLNVVYCGALCRQQRPRVHVPAEGPRGPEAGRESHAAVWSGQHAAGQRPGVLTEEPQVVSHTHTHPCLLKRVDFTVEDVKTKLTVWSCCLYQHSALRSHPPVHQLGADWLGATLWHPARPHQRLQGEEEDPAQHRAPHHAQGEEPLSANISSILESYLNVN